MGSRTTTTSSRASPSRTRRVDKSVRHSRVHLWLTGVWVAAAVPTVVWWRESILWVAFMSLYANVAGHWAAYEAARAKEENDG